MKKFFLSLIFAAFTFSSFAMQATVVSTKGKAEVQNGSSWVALNVGDTLDQGAVIQTGFKSEVILKIKESTVTVAPLTRITLQTLAEKNGVGGAQGKDETAIFLDTGSLKSNVQKSQDRRVGFTVRSPVATASVRGTEFNLGTRFRGVHLATKQGKVAFWKNTPKSEAALDAAAANADEPAEEAGQGDSAQDISDYAPKGAIVVSKGENAAAQSNSNSATPPAAVARGNSTSVGSGTQSAASAEAAAHAENLPVGTTPSDAGSGGAKAASASLTIKVEYEN